MNGTNSKLTVSIRGLVEFSAEGEPGWLEKMLNLALASIGRSDVPSTSIVGLGEPAPGPTSPNTTSLAPPSPSVAIVPESRGSNIQPPPPPPPVAAEAPAMPAEPSDLAIFGRLNKLKDIVQEWQRRGKKDFPEILAACQSLKDAEVSPVLSRLQDWENGLRACCVSLKIPGAV